MITINMKGQLGNQIVQYIVCRLTANIHNYEFSLDKGPSPVLLLDIFEDLDIGINNFHVKYNYRQEQKKSTNIMNFFINDIKDYTYLEGFYQNMFFFSHKMDEIKTWFKTKNYNVEYVEKFDYDNLLFVHYRTEFRERDKGVLDYFNEAIKKFPDKKVIIVTDNIDKSNRDFGDYEVIKNSFQTDFEILRRAKNIVLSNSSFSYCACYLGNAEKISIPKGGMHFQLHKFRGYMDDSSDVKIVNYDNIFSYPTDKNGNFFI